MDQSASKSHDRGFVVRHLGRQYRAESDEIVQQALPDLWKELAERLGELRDGTVGRPSGAESDR